MTCPSVAEGVRLFNAKRYFDAHEEWEALWHKSEGEQKNRLQGLIQAAVALHHHSNANRKGALYLLGKAKTRLANGFPDGVKGECAIFLLALEAFLKKEMPAGDSRRAPQIQI